MAKGTKVLVKRGSGRNRILSTLDFLSKVVTKVGWFGTSSKAKEIGEYKERVKGKKIYDAYKAQANEFGAPSTNGTKRPARPFIFQDQNKSVIGLRDSLQKNKKWSKRNIKDGFKSLGDAGKIQIQKNIDNVFTPPLSKTTITLREMHKNKSQKPLIDTGSMRKNVKGKVEVE